IFTLIPTNCATSSMKSLTAKRRRCCATVCCEEWWKPAKIARRSNLPSASPAGNAASALRKRASSTQNRVPWELNLHAFFADLAHRQFKTPLAEEVRLWSGLDRAQIAERRFLDARLSRAGGFDYLARIHEGFEHRRTVHVAVARFFGQAAV